MIFVSLGGDRGGGDRINNSHVMPIGEIEVQQFPDTIFVQGLAEDVSEETLAQHFGAIGKLKVWCHLYYCLTHLTAHSRNYVTLDCIELCCN